VLAPLIRVLMWESQMHRMIIDGGTRLGEAPDKLAVSLCEVARRIAGVLVEIQLIRASLDIRFNCS